ncbi:emp24/gp25L/p24 family protein [Dictyobacter arantiisoli]|uniref:Uncharacterized protein n=1 Tax=Dictyobacter arantiisoli TaxID=2014874 RepID=A0A5A5TE55_9CHLR|nr:emp24/gp25L/p24 family protein [Dictyobacter arantiisoli]GCF09841.1 hypothetical protein KDI_34050 [Dictyobacter arantiisoli]
MRYYGSPENLSREQVRETSNGASNREVEQFQSGLYRTEHPTIIPESDLSRRQEESQLLKNWVSTSTVKVKFLRVDKPRSEALQGVDKTVASLAVAYEGRDDRSKFNAALDIRDQLEHWRETKQPEHISEREDAVTQLEHVVQSVIDNFYRPMEQRMRALPASSENTFERVWIHGTDAIGEIMESGEIWGGTAALKILGRDNRQREAVAGQIAFDQAQEQHFFMALTEENGATASPGNAFTKGRQAADHKIREGSQSYLHSWKYADRPLMGVIEFPSHQEDADPQESETIRAIRTNESSEDYRSTLPLHDLNPIGIRMVNEGDVVRMLSYIHDTNKEQLSQLPQTIKVLRNSSWNGGSPNEWSALLGEKGDYKRLMTENNPSRWSVYRTNDVLRALGYA